MSTVELSFELPGSGHALFTTRAQGNLSTVGGRDAEQGRRARERLREQIGVPRLERGYQVHGSAVRRVAEQDDHIPSAAEARRSPGGARSGPRPGSLRAAPLPRLPEADGHATSLQGIGLMVLVADCLPVVIGRKGAVAALHVGWRGLAGGVLEEGVRALRDVGGRGEVVAIVGPGAGACCYEVGEEVHAAFGDAHREGRLIDLRAIARDRLLGAGVAEVRDAGLCTVCDERFFSHRREGDRAGRQAGVAWLS